MLKEEAAQKWCPFAIAQWAPGFSGSTTSGTITVGSSTGVFNLPQAAVPPVSANRAPGGEMHYDCRCITTRCMAWHETLGDPTRGHCARLGYVP